MSGCDAVGKISHIVIEDEAENTDKVLCGFREPLPIDHLAKAGGLGTTAGAATAHEVIDSLKWRGLRQSGRSPFFSIPSA